MDCKLCIDYYKFELVHSGPKLVPHGVRTDNTLEYRSFVLCNTVLGIQLMA